MRAAAVALAALVACPLVAAFASAPSPHTTTASGAFSGYLTGVACPGAGDCWAVGQTTGGFAVADHWTGSSWSVVHLPGPRGATFSYLPSVSCTSASYCWAVGQYKVTGDDLAYAEHWNGTAWSVAAMPSPARTINTLPIAVSCSSATRCWAVGTADLLPLFERWNGHTWAIVPTPAIGSRNIPERVDCVSGSDCWATGLNDTNGALTAHWDGAAWTPVTTPLSTNTGDELLGVSCPSAAACMAVGDSRAYSHPLAARWNGSAWTISLSGTVPAPLNGVSCTAGLRCAAVGATSGGMVFSEIWTGSRWRKAAIQVPAGTSGLVGVACPGPSDCWAVGNQSQAVRGSSLIEHWNGARWSIVG